jgi:protein-tyrosine phosphatase
MAFDQGARTLDVPDPYYAGQGMFDEVLVMIESGSRALFRQLEPAIRPALSRETDRRTENESSTHLDR